jgi:hypothetical protein
MSFTLKTFDDFVHRNIKMLLNVSVDKHPVNQKNIRKWIDKHDDEIDKSVALIISNNITNVSYEDFIDKLNDIVNDLYHLYENKRCPLLLYVQTDKKKSNFFMGVILYWLCKKKGIIFDDILDLDMECPEIDGEVILVIPDDASYSGHHIYSEIEMSRICSDITFTYFIACPYISKQSKKYISDGINEHMSDDIKIIYTPSSSVFFSIGELVKNQLNIDITERYDDYLSTKHLLYFDFKIANNFSIIQSILVFGYTILNNDIDHVSDEMEDGILPLISGCDTQYMKLNPDRYRDDLNDSMIPTCPYSFYKHLVWK